MRPRYALPIAAALVVALTGCSAQEADKFAEALKSATAPAAAQPDPAVDVNQARQQLAGLTITPEGSGAGYSREKFPHWSTVSGACDTREAVLVEQGQRVRVDPDTCRPVTGTWLSPYDGGVWTQASDVDIDHVVPLAEAWRSGAARWTTAEREQFANDRWHPQLLAVTDNLNQAKGAQDPARWRPPLRSYWCTYADDWIAVKDAYRLTADAAEVAALRRMLDTCGGGS